MIIETTHALFVREFGIQTQFWGWENGGNLYFPVNLALIIGNGIYFFCLYRLQHLLSAERVGWLYLVFALFHLLLSLVKEHPDMILRPVELLYLSGCFLSIWLVSQSKKEGDAQE